MAFLFRYFTRECGPANVVEKRFVEEVVEALPRTVRAERRPLPPCGNSVAGWRSKVAQSARVQDGGARVEAIWRNWAARTIPQSEKLNLLTSIPTQVHEARAGSEALARVCSNG